MREEDEYDKIFHNKKIYINYKIVSFFCVHINLYYFYFTFNYFEVLNLNSFDYGFHS